MAELNIPLIATFIFYLAVIFTLGIIANLRTKNLSDYILGGRNLSGPLAALGAGASDMSGWLLMALPGAVYLHGIQEIWLPIGLAIGAYCNWLFVAKRLRVYTEVANDSLTMPAYFDNRFQDKKRVLRSITAIVVLIFFTFYVASGFVAGAFLTKNILHLISYHEALFISALIIVAYVTIGGFIAVAWVDFFQGSLMFIALLVVPIFTIWHLGGLPALNAHMQATHIPHYFEAWEGMSVLGIISLLAWGLGYFGQPHIIVRFMAAKSKNVIPQARFICMTWMILALYGAILTGFAGHAFMEGKGHVNAETIFLILAEDLFHSWIGGVLIAAVLSAIMSTIAAQLLVSASALSEDFYRAFIRPGAKAKELVWVARSAVILVALVAVGLALNPNGTILQLVSYAWAGFGASFGPIILFSLFWRRMTLKGAVVGIIVGASTVIVWSLLGEHVGGIFKLYSIVPGFILNSLCIYFISLCDKPPSAALLEQHERFTQKLVV